ncbi:MAG: serine/threonine protein kinase [Myxococcota bacterium]
MSPPESPPRRFGDYFLIKKIATGGMAEIFLAKTRTAQGPEKYVALKMIHTRYMEERNFHHMIAEEAKIAVQLGHKNIGQVFDLGQVDGRYFIVMEYIDGYDLSRLHDACRQKLLPIPFEIAAFVGHEVCAALTYAHKLRDRSGQALNLIHRDISPQNILLSFQGEIKLIDFGIAKVATQMQQTQVGVIKGKFYYMSPEQAGAADIDQRSDLFSLGICLWETICGRPLFRREGGPTNPLAILHEIRSMRIPRVRELRPECPPQLDALVAQALSRDRDARFSSAVDMKAAFSRFLLTEMPDLDPREIVDFMVAAYDKVETTKETARITTKMADLMQRTDFQPGGASVIFALPSAGASERDLADVQTAIFKPEVRTGVAEGLAAPVRPPEVSPSSGDLAVSNTVFLRKDHVEELRARGEKAESYDTGGEADPNGQTQAISEADIDAARDALRNNPTATTYDDLRLSDEPGPLSEHPLFRWLIIAVLVLCILTATLALMLLQRSRQVERMNDKTPAAETIGTETHETAFRPLG